MIVLMLEDETGRIWPDFVIGVGGRCHAAGLGGEAWEVREAERQLYRNFALYWLGGRFKRIPDDMAREIGKMLQMNGWKIRQFDAKEAEVQP